MPYDPNGNLILSRVPLANYPERYLSLIYHRVNPVNGFGATLNPPTFNVLAKFNPGAAPAATKAGLVGSPAHYIYAGQQYDAFYQRYQYYVDNPGEIYGPDGNNLPEDHPGLRKFTGIWLENVTVNGTGWNSLVKVNVRKGGCFEAFGPRFVTGLLGSVEITGPGAEYWQVHQSPITETDRLEVYVKRDAVGENIPATTFRFTPNYEVENPTFPEWDGRLGFPEQGVNGVTLSVVSEHYADWEGQSALIPPDNITFQRCFAFYEYNWAINEGL